MIKCVIDELTRSGFQASQIVMTLERYMQCGIGKCGHCNLGEQFVCVDGPVFRYDELLKFPEKESAI